MLRAKRQGDKRSTHSSRSAYTAYSPAGHKAERFLPQNVHGDGEASRPDEVQRPPLAALIHTFELPDHDDRSEGAGIAYAGSAASLARENTYADSMGCGIPVILQAQPTLEGNTCQRTSGNSSVTPPGQTTRRAASCASALVLIPTSAVLETHFAIRFLIGQGTLDDQESDNLVYIDALTQGQRRDNLGYPLGNFWGIASSLLRGQLPARPSCLHLSHMASFRCGNACPHSAIINHGEDKR
jgi:hypothetical protein